MRCFSRSLMTGLIVVATSLQFSAIQAQDDETTARVTAEVTAHMTEYYRLFSNWDMEALPDEIFTIPWMTFGASGMNVSSDRNDALVRWQGSLIGLLERGWDHSEFTVENVCVLNAGMAIVSGYNTRFAEDGSEMSVGSLAYFLTTTEAGWRIVGYTGVDRGKLVSC